MKFIGLLFLLLLLFLFGIVVGIAIFYEGLKRDKVLRTKVQKILNDYSKDDA